MSTITLVHEREIPAPADQVWAVVADYRRDVEWRAGVVAMEPTPSGLVAPGTTTIEQLRLAGRTHRNAGIVLGVEPGARFEWRTTSGAEAEGSRTVVPIGPEPEPRGARAAGHAPWPRPPVRADGTAPARPQPRRRRRTTGDVGGLAGGDSR